MIEQPNKKLEELNKKGGLKMAIKIYRLIEGELALLSEGNATEVTKEKLVNICYEEDVQEILEDIKQLILTLSMLTEKDSMGQDYLQQMKEKYAEVY